MDVNVKTLRRDLAEYLKRAERGEEVVITRKGVPVAKLVSARGSGGIDFDALDALHKNLNLQLDHNPVLDMRSEERY